MLLRHRVWTAGRAESTRYTIHLEDLNLETIHKGIATSRQTRDATTDHNDFLDMSHQLVPRLSIVQRAHPKVSFLRYVSRLSGCAHGTRLSENLFFDRLS
jgi:hypothetical protein